MSTELFFYKWFVNDWRNSNARRMMTSIERCLYREVVDFCWLMGALPSDEEDLCRIADMPKREFLKAWPRVRQQFSVGEDGLLHHRRIDRDRPAALRQVGGRQHVAKLGAEARWAKKGAQAGGEPASRLASISLAAPELRQAVGRPAQPEIGNLEAEFEELWSLHPRAQKQPLCQQLFTELWRSCTEQGRDWSELRNQIMAPLRPGGKWVASEAWAKDGGRYIPGLDSYLSQKRWLENPEPGAGGSAAAAPSKRPKGLKFGEVWRPRQEDDLPTPCKDPEGRDGMLWPNGLFEPQVDPHAGKTKAEYFSWRLGLTIEELRKKHPELAVD